MNMKDKRSSRTFIIILLIGILAFGLTSCKLPASKGPETVVATSEGFPVPGDTQQTGGGQVNTPATQTAQALPPGTSPTQVPEIATPSSPYPAPTTVRCSTATSAPVVYVQPTPGGPPPTYTLAKVNFILHCDGLAIRTSCLN
jgi:hypothetical protein